MSTPILPDRLAALGRGAPAWSLPLLLFLGYLVFGCAVRPMFLADIAANSSTGWSWLSAGLASAASAVVMWQWRRRRGLVRGAARAAAGGRLGLLAVVGRLERRRIRALGAGRQELNYQASVALGRLLPPGTLVQGKLANGLALENRIQPLFIGNGFGNYDDRLQRDDARYILTYDLPSVGYESQADSGLIQELLDRYPQQSHHRDIRGRRDAAPSIGRRSSRSGRSRRTSQRMREIRDDLIKAHADRRFRSEYDYALFEYYRSAKVLAFLERAGVAIAGRVLDAGCGGGGMPLSFAEHARQVVGIDPIDRFSQAGVKLAQERQMRNLGFAQADGHGAALSGGRLRSRAVARRDRARARRAAVSAASAAACSRVTDAAICRRRRTCRSRARICRGCACRFRCI